ncbi:MAG: hypothetical protein ACJ8KA_09560 [Sulfurifustis sp.]
MNRMLGMFLQIPFGLYAGYLGDAPKMLRGFGFTRPGYSLDKE